MSINSLGHNAFKTTYWCVFSPNVGLPVIPSPFPSYMKIVPDKLTGNSKMYVFRPLQYLHTSLYCRFNFKWIQLLFCFFSIKNWNLSFPKSIQTFNSVHDTAITMLHFRDGFSQDMKSSWCFTEIVFGVWPKRFNFCHIGPENFFPHALRVIYIFFWQTSSRLSYAFLLIVASV